MPIEKALLLKGLGVCALCAGGTTVALKWGDISNALFSPSESRKEKITWGGLECEEPTEEEGGECSIKTGEKAGKIFVKKKTGSSHFQLTTLEGGGKIKVYKVQKTEGEEEYKDGFKFLVEEGDIGTTENNKLEEFETYEIKKGTDSNEADLKDQYFLSQKSDSKTEIKKALGLPWDLPDNTPSDHTGINTDKLKDIKFKGGTASITGENVTLTISKEANKEDFPLGYKFTFKNTSDTAATLTIGDEVIKIKNNSPIDFDFKIKRNGSSLSLEKAWSIENLAKKVGLVKDGEGDFWDVGTSGLNVKVDDTTKKDKKTKKTGSAGKIKVSEGQTEYNGGFKFTIENDDLILEDSGSPDITLGQFQSYEIVKDGENLYLFKKEEAKVGIKKALGLPWDLPDSSDDHANITNNDLKTIKFKGGTASISGGTVTLTITKDTTGNDYPLGYKFSFKNTNDSDATLTYGGETVILRQNSPVEFKIKKEGSSISLEKAWSLEDLTQKVGLKKDGEEYWFVGDSGMNVKLDESTKKTNKVKYSSPTGRIKVYSDQKGYNEGLKFTVEKGDLDLKEDTSGSQTINLGQFQSFEIIKDTGVWYLSRKEGDQSRIKELLGLANSNCEFPTEAATPKECTLTNENIGSAKFEGAGQGSVTVSGSPKLTIHKESGRYSYPLGYRFTFTSSSGNSSISIPASSGTPTSITLKKGVDIDYKIKVSGANKDVLTLEKAWTADDLIGETGIKKDGSDAWSVGSSSISIKHDSSKKSTNATASGTQKAKIRVYEGSPGYNQGYKFVVEEGDTGLDDGKGVSKLTKYETYEVSVDDTDKQWYFTRKLSLPNSMREILGLPDTCSFPTTEQSPTNCSLDSAKLKEVKFKDADSVTVSGGGSVTLNITKESNTTSYPLGYKFTFNSNNEFKIKENGGKSTLEKV